MTMYGDVFCDTNIVIRFNVVKSPEHMKVRSAIEVLIQDGNTLWISRQVLREFCMALTRPQSFPISLSVKDVVTRARILATKFNVADEPKQVTENLFTLLETIPMGENRFTTRIS